MSDKKSKLKRSRISSEESDSSSTSSSVTSSSDDETDAKDLKPIKEYMSNRKELASQLFKSVKTEKIRMMLPQILKKVEFNDLEELCANELIGMSRTRIMCVISGQEMLQSSNTDESDDLGPTLEIISDTEWLSDEEMNVKEGENLKNKSIKKTKKKYPDQKKQEPQPKCKGKGKLNVQIKTEVKEKEKPKEGESLLDLLELEMRARAIRALIRKEEDSSSSKNVQINDSIKLVPKSKTSNDKSTKARQENLKEQLEKIDVLMNHGEDEDVFVVIQPAPTIELLSSESETEDHSERVNQKLVNERTPESKKIQEDLSTKNKAKEISNKSSEKNVNINKEKSDKKAKNENSKESDNCNENASLSVTKADNSVNDKADNSNKLLNTLDLEEGEIIDDNDENIVNEKIEIINECPSKRKIKRIKRNPFIRSRKKNKENNNDNIKDIPIKISENKESKSENDDNVNNKETAVTMDLIEIEESPKKENKETILDLKEKENNAKIDPFDDKLLDIDEVINLDDYPDDMDELEKSEFNNEIKGTNAVKVSTNKSTDKESFNNVPSRSETWTTRYYRQDDVQNVIKESKIQSEIRKRLRERQRQSKLNNPSKLKEQNALQQSLEPLIPKPTGSVKEYLALKGFPSEISNSTSEVAESSELLKENNSLISSNDAVIAINPLTEGESESETNLLVHEKKAIEQSIETKEKVKVIDDVAIGKTVDSTSNEDTAVEQLNKHKKCSDSLVNISAACIEKLKESSSEKSEQNKLNNFKEIVCPLRINETSLISDSSADKTSVKVDSIVLSDNKFVHELNNKKINEEKIESSKSKTSELRPD